MRYSTTINNKKALDFGLNIQLAYLFAWFYELPSWAESVIISGELYYFASKNKAIKELPLLTDKADTMYRYYKKLESLNLIDLKKIDGKDYIKITEKGKEWNEWQSEHSEINPNELGNKSENNSEINPTYNNIIYNNNTSNNKTENKFSDEVLSCFNSCLEFFEEHLHPGPAEKLKWLDTIEKLQRIDKIPFEKIIEIVKKTRQDSFWRSNFLSLNKLRKKKDGVMYIVIFNEKIKSKAPQQSAGEKFMNQFNF